MKEKQRLRLFQAGGWEPRSNQVSDGTDSAFIIPNRLELKSANGVPRVYGCASG